MCRSKHASPHYPPHPIPLRQIGYIGRPGSFFVYVLVYNLFQLVSETIGMLCAMLTKNSTYAILVRLKGREGRRAGLSPSSLGLTLFA